MSGDPAAASDPILAVDDLCVDFDTAAGRIRPVDHVSFAVGAGEALGIVGESGSGKSVTALSIMNLLDESGRIAGGTIRFKGVNLLTLNRRELELRRGRDFAMVFQDPMTSLNPVIRIAKQLVEAILVHRRIGRSAALVRAIELLRRMGVPAPERAVRQYPHQFSGGMRQRVMLAMGLSNDPTLLIADEPTTALDVTIQAQILDLLRELKTDFAASVVLISHDLGVIASISSRVAVMYAGEMVEVGPTEQLLANPKHPYTLALINAAPRLDRPPAHDKRLRTIEGLPPDPLAWPDGCRFAARCRFRIADCARHPELWPSGGGRAARCWVTRDGSDLPSRQEDVDAAPAGAPAQARASRGAAATAPAAVLRIVDVRKHFAGPRAGWLGRRLPVRAVDGVDFEVRKGETVGLVGESGCGKSTLARLIVGIQRPTTGRVEFDGVDIAAASQRTIRPLRRRLQMIFQDPYASLNPRMSVGDILGEPLRHHGITKGSVETTSRIARLLELVGLPARSSDKYPHEFSGGQRQRISIARALAAEPEFVVADEPISSLDVNIQAQILNLLVDLQARLNLTYLLISHDMAVVRHVSDRIVVLYLGKVMEIAAADDLFDHPLHPYTRSLISAVPVPDAAVERRRVRHRLQGEAPSSVNPPSGCRFRTRCPIAQPRCAEEVPLPLEHRPGQWAACHFPVLQPMDVAWRTKSAAGL